MLTGVPALFQQTWNNGLRGLASRQLFGFGKSACPIAFDEVVTPGNSFGDQFRRMAENNRQIADFGHIRRTTHEIWAQIRQQRVEITGLGLSARRGITWADGANITRATGIEGPL